MEKMIKDLTVREFQFLINNTVKKAFNEISEDIFALSSKNYLSSIEEARRNFNEGKVKSFDEVFNV